MMFEGFTAFAIKSVMVQKFLQLSWEASACVRSAGRDDGLGTNQKQAPSVGVANISPRIEGGAEKLTPAPTPPARGTPRLLDGSGPVRLA